MAAIFFIILILLGLFFLWKLFFTDTARDGKKDCREAAKIQSMIANFEKDNPEFVKKLREGLTAETQLDRVKRTEPEEIGTVVKHWLEDDKKY
mgnify:CR=1 FL=1